MLCGEAGESVAFVATKPLQIMISMAISDQLRPESRFHLVVVTDFCDADVIANRLRACDSRWSDVTVVSSKRDAIAQCAEAHYDRVFIDSDVGLRNAWSLKALKASVPSMRLCVLEEGVGTYRQDIYPPGRGLAVRALGASSHFGGLSVTDEVWVYSPEAYRSCFPRQAHKVRAMDSSLQSWISDNVALLELIFVGGSLDDSLLWGAEGGRCVLYLTSWIWSAEACATVGAWGGRSVLKLHPHIRTDEDQLHRLFDYVVPASIPAELVVLALARRFDEVVVFHHGTSTEQYIDHPGLVFHNLGEP